MSSRKISVGSLARSSASIVDDIVRHLERLIVTGALAAGEKIPSERSLSVELGVSRPVLREALSRLEAAGLVTRRHGSGTRVTGGLPPAGSPAPRAGGGRGGVGHSPPFRGGGEPANAPPAAPPLSDEQLGALREIIEGSDRDPDADHSVQLDVAFHVAVAQAAGNPLLAALAELTASWTVEARDYSHLEGDGRRISHEGHSRVLAALEQRDGDAAAREMAVHLKQIRAVIDRVRASESAET